MLTRLRHWLLCRLGRHEWERHLGLGKWWCPRCYRLGDRTAPTREWLRRQADLEDASAEKEAGGEIR